MQRDFSHIKFKRDEVMNTVMNPQCVYQIYQNSLFFQENKRIGIVLEYITIQTD